jgi:hypothetical protein
METTFENTTVRVTHVYELECKSMFHISTCVTADARYLEESLTGGQLTHPLGRRWAFELSFASNPDPTPAHLEGKRCRLVLSWLPLQASGEAHKANNPWLRLTIWEVRFITQKSQKVLWKRKVCQARAWLGPDLGTYSISFRQEMWEKFCAFRI